MLVLATTNLRFKHLTNALPEAQNSTLSVEFCGIWRASSRVIASSARTCPLFSMLKSVHLVVHLNRKNCTFAFVSGSQNCTSFLYIEKCTISKSVHVQRKWVDIGQILYMYNVFCAKIVHVHHFLINNCTCTKYIVPAGFVHLIMKFVHILLSCTKK